MKTTAEAVLDRCVGAYGEIPSFLSYKNAFELLISVILSAQTTDAQVNKVSPVLFSRFPDARALALAELHEVEDIVRSTGYYRAKSKNIRGAAAHLVEHHNGTVPSSMEDLVKIPGVGRKSAGVVLFHIFSQPAIIVDTHFGRVCRRLGLTQEQDPVKLEFSIAEQLPRSGWGTASMLFNLHGRRFCLARSPRCGECFLNDLCPNSGMT